MRVELANVALEVEDHGEGVPVVLLHGFPLSSGIWDPIRPALEQVVRLITPDLRGFGGSDASEGDYDVDTMADDILRLADVLGLEKFVLGGHSMGGYVALRIAACQPARLLGLVLVDTRAEADSFEARARRNASIDWIRRRGSADFLADFIPNLLSPETRRRARRFVDELLLLAAEVPDHVLIGCLAGMRDRPDSTSLLPGIDVPALVITGKEDTVTPPSVAETMARRLPRATLAVIPEAGHTPMVERPVTTADVISAFLRKHFAAKSAVRSRQFTVDS